MFSPEYNGNVAQMNWDELPVPCFCRVDNGGLVFIRTACGQIPVCITVHQPDEGLVYAEKYPDRWSVLHVDQELKLSTAGKTVAPPSPVGVPPTSAPSTTW